MATDAQALETARCNSLGRLARLADQTIAELVLPLLDDKTLIYLGTCSHWCYVLTRQESHWRQRFLERILRRPPDTKDSSLSPSSTTDGAANDKRAKARLAALQAMAYYDGSWYSAMQQLLRAQHQLPPDEQLSANYRRFDGAVGRYWPIHIPAVRSWYLFAQWQLAHASLAVLHSIYTPAALQVPCVHSTVLSVERFQREFNATGSPVLIDGCAMDWPAHANWNLDRLSEQYADTLFRVSIEQPGPRPDRIGQFYMTMQHYVNYCRKQQDVSPIYIFDAGFGERAPSLLKDYKVPRYFTQDYLSVLPDTHRPPYRWFVMGPARSGASWHIDPSATSAWNTLLLGRKRWALYPGNQLPPGVYRQSEDDDIHSPTSLYWFQHIYPTLPPELRPVECIQEPGQTIFVPGGWWHMVLNLNDTVAVTQNFADDQNLDMVCQDLAEDEKQQELFQLFTQLVVEQHPQLHPFMAQYCKEAAQVDQSTHSSALTEPAVPLGQRVETLRLIQAEGFCNREALAASFTDLSIWQPRCSTVTARHNISSTATDTVEPLSTGHNPVFLLSQCWLVKFYAPMGGHAAYARELAALTMTSDHPLLQQCTPTLLAHGHLGCPADCSDQHQSSDLPAHWHWPYVVMQRRSGHLMQQLLNDEQMHRVNWEQLLPWLARTVAAIHTAPSPVSTCTSQPSFRCHLLQLASGCQQRHLGWRHLPTWLIDQLPHYLEPLVAWLQGRAQDNIAADIQLAGVEAVLSRATWIHGDLNAQNILGDWPMDGQYGNWQATGLIDFADTVTQADPLWDLVPLHVAMLGGLPRLFARFLQHYRALVPDRFADNACTPAVPTTSWTRSRPRRLLRRRRWHKQQPATATTTTARHSATRCQHQYPFTFPYLMTCYLLLWPYEGVVRWLFAERAELNACRSLDHLARKLWPQRLHPQRNIKQA